MLDTFAGASTIFTILSVLSIRFDPDELHLDSRTSAKKLSASSVGVSLIFLFDVSEKLEVTNPFQLKLFFLGGEFWSRSVG